MQNTKYVEGYSLAEFCVALQEAILEGYSVDTSKNETYPVAYGSHLTATLVKRQADNSSSEVIRQDKEQPTAEVNPPAAKRTKKAT